MKALLRKLLSTPATLPLAHHLAYLFFQKVLRINGRVPWPVHPTSRVVHPERIQRGKTSTPGDMPHCYIQGTNGIIIGEGCEFGPGVGLISANHDPLNLAEHLPSEPIQIGDGCWIGMNAIILPGVVLGPMTIIGAGAVVTKSYPEGFQTLVGNPARVAKIHSKDFFREPNERKRKNPDHAR